MAAGRRPAGRGHGSDRSPAGCRGLSPRGCRSASTSGSDSPWLTIHPRRTCEPSWIDPRQRHLHPLRASVRLPEIHRRADARRRGRHTQGAGPRDRVYGKTADFNTAADPIVRVDARRLRDRLRDTTVRHRRATSLFPYPKAATYQHSRRPRHQRSLQIASRHRHDVPSYGRLPRPPPSRRSRWQPHAWQALFCIEAAASLRPCSPMSSSIYPPAGRSSTSRRRSRRTAARSLSPR